MPRSVFYLVSDDTDMICNARDFWEPRGVSVQVFSPSQWNQGLDSQDFRHQVKVGVPALALGSQPLTEGAKVLQFKTIEPQQVDNRVKTMDEIESVAIQNAIREFKGNLTEAAKALGIGRATLYRKVKQYNIDPSEARRLRAA